nr:GEM-like protein 4 [Ipomoea trifida]
MKSRIGEKLQVPINYWAVLLNQSSTKQALLDSSPTQCHLSSSSKLRFGAVRLRPKITDTVKGKLILGAKLLQAGGVQKVFNKKFSAKEGEKLLKASQSEEQFRLSQREKVAADPLANEDGVCVNLQQTRATSQCLRMWSTLSCVSPQAMQLPSSVSCLLTLTEFVSSLSFTANQRNMRHLSEVFIFHTQSTSSELSPPAMYL